MKLWFKLLLGILVASAAAGSAHAQALTPTDISASPGSVKPGDAVTFSVEVSNSGNAPFAPPDTVDFEIMLTNTETGYSFTLNVAGVPPKGSVTAATPATATEPATPGTGTFDVTAVIPTQTTDAGPYRATVRISNASTGTASGSFSVSDPILTVTGTPDLMITSLTYPAGVFYQGGDVIPMTLTYTNAPFTFGEPNVPWSATSGSPWYRIEVVLSTNPAFGDADDYLLTFHDFAARLPADGVNRTVSWNQLLPGNYAGSYYVLAKIDVLGQVAETTTNDNDFTINGNNVWYDVQATRIALEPTTFPTVYLASTTGTTSGNSYSDNPATSSDGRYTVFVSDSADLVTGDTNAQRDIFIFDIQTVTTRRVNVSQQGAQANAASSNPSISADGRLVAFASDATNLVFGDTNGFTDIFVVDVISGAITRESLSTGGGQANGSSFRPSLSSDGRYVAFESTANNLVAGATSGLTQIYVRDRTAGTTTLVSQSGGVAGNAASVQAAISGGGRYVAFASDASNLATSDTNGVRDVFVRDVFTATTIRASVATGGGEGNGASRSPSINRNPGNSADGRYVAFSSTASNLVASDTNGISDVFVYDVLAGTTTRVSVSSTGVEAFDPTDTILNGSRVGSVNPSISATGRYVAFASLANNLARGDFAGQYLGTDGNGSLDVFVRDRDVSGSGTFDVPGNVGTQMVSVNRFGFQTIRILGIPSTAASDIFPSISGDGRWVAYPTDSDRAQGLAHLATNRLSNDQNGFRDVFLFDRRINALPNPVPLPSVTITTPANGSSIAVNTSETIAADASTPNGTIRSVQFFANSDPIGAAITAPPYQVEWTPTSDGVYRLTAVALDSIGALATSDTVVVMASSAPADAVATGTYQGGTEFGNFALMSVGGRAALIAYSTSPGTNRTYFATGMPIDSSGGFGHTEESGVQLVSGTLNETGASGTLDDGRITFIGLDTKHLATGTPQTTRYYTGTLQGKPSSQVAVIVGTDRSIMLYVADGSFTDAGGGGLTGKLDGSGNFNVLSMRGNRFTGRVDPSSGLLNLTLSGSNGGTYVGGPSTLASNGTTVADGTASQVGTNIVHSNGNVYDQVLLQGSSATITADPGEITRISFMDLTNDIIQLEFSGAGTLSVSLENASGPKAPANYSQPGIEYMQGHASIVITGADETTNVSVFSVGSITAQNQTLFKSGVDYDGVADIAYIVILSPSGKFGGIRAGNTHFFASSGLTGICAPGVEFTGPIYVGDISAAGTASPMFLAGSAKDTYITGGSLFQLNAQPVNVSGLTLLRFSAGSTSHGDWLEAQYNRARFVQNGADLATPLASAPQ